MYTSTKFATTENLLVEEKTDSKTDSDVSRRRETQTVAPPPKQAKFNPQNISKPNCTDETNQATDFTNSETSNLKLNPAQARWLSIGEKIGTLLSEIKVKLFG